MILRSLLFIKLPSIIHSIFLIAIIQLTSFFNRIFLDRLKKKRYSHMLVRKNLIDSFTPCYVQIVFPIAKTIDLENSISNNLFRITLYLYRQSQSLVLIYLLTNILDFNYWKTRAVTFLKSLVKKSSVIGISRLS